MLKPKDVISLEDIDAFWLSRTIMDHYKDKMPEEQQELERRIMNILKAENPRECERKLFAVLGPEKYELVHLLVKNKSVIHYGTRYYQT